MQAVELAAQKKARIALAEQQMDLRRAQAASPARPSLVRRWVTSVMPGREAQPEQQVQGLRYEVGCGRPASCTQPAPSGSILYSPVAIRRTELCVSCVFLSGAGLWHASCGKALQPLIEYPLFTAHMPARQGHLTYRLAAVFHLVCCNAGCCPGVPVQGLVCGGLGAA